MRLPIPGVMLPIPDVTLPISDARLPTSDARLPIHECKVDVMSFPGGSEPKQRPRTKYSTEKDWTWMYHCVANSYVKEVE